MIRVPQTIRSMLNSKSIFEIYSSHSFGMPSNILHWVFLKEPEMVFKSVNNQAPTYLTEMFVRLSDSCKRELRNTKTDLAVPHCNTTFGQKCFSHKGAKLWNDLSFEIKSSRNYEIFKTHICNVKS